MNTTKKITLSKTALTLSLGLLSLSLSPAAAFADAVEANIGATSNYVWRGATQTDDGAAISGGIDYGHESGLYVGTWASNVDFGGGGEVEWDVYAGYGGEANGVGYDFGYIAYLYPDSRDSNFHELATSVSYGLFSAGANFTFASDVDDTAAGAEGFIDGDIYLYSGLSYDISDTWSAGFTLGYYMFEDDGVGGAELDYVHGQLDLTKSAGNYGDFTFSLSAAEEEANGGDDDLKVFVSWAKGF